MRAGFGVVAVLLLCGCTDSTSLPLVPPPSPTATTLPASSPGAGSEVFDGACFDLLDYTGEFGGTNANQVGRLFQTYHSAGRPHEPASRVQAVAAGGGYWVVAGVVYDETTAWLAWDDSVTAQDDPPYGNFLRWAEITSLELWDGGETPFGPPAVAAALGCLG